MIIAGMVAVVVLGAIVLRWTTTPSGALPTPTISASPGENTASRPVKLPHVAPIAATLTGWQTAPGTAAAFVGPESGDAANGSVAARVDAPIVEAPFDALSTAVAVTPGTEYVFTAKARVLSADGRSIPAALYVGDTEVPLPQLNARWTEVSGRVTSAGASLTLRVRIDAPIVGLAVDDLSLAAVDGPNLVPNPSFEDFTASSKLVNESLLLSADTASLAIIPAPGNVDWSIKRGDQLVSSGSLESNGSLVSVSLRDVPQGYYTFSLTDSASSLETPIAVLQGDVTHTDARFGVGMHVEDSWYANAARYARSLGIAEARNDVLWQLNERKRGVYDFDPRYTEGFDRLHANGIKVLGIVAYGNKLYGSELTPETPEAIAAYGNYAAAVAQRFDVVGLEVFNEFNQDRFNNTACGTAPHCYVPLVKAAHDSVRAVAPSIPIVVGSTARYDAPWFDGLWQAGAMPYTDVTSYHPYELNDVQLGDVIEESKRSMLENGGEVKPIWITEIGTPSYPGWLTHEQQATELFKNLAITLGHGAEKFFWYDLINDSTDMTVHQGNFGLFFREADGVAAYAPKPSAFVYAMLIQRLSGKPAAATQPDRRDDLMAYDFGTGADKVTLAWATGDTASMKITVDGPVQVTLTDGATSIVQPAKGVATVEVPKAGAIIQRAAAPSESSATAP